MSLGRFFMDRADLRAGQPIAFCFVLHFAAFQLSTSLFIALACGTPIALWWLILRIRRNDTRHFVDHR